MINPCSNTKAAQNIRSTAWQDCQAYWPTPFLSLLSCRTSRRQWMHRALH